ncbi:MAG: hypothetical protein ACPLZG_11650 [Thermoproteota archaeon]
MKGKQIKKVEVSIPEGVDEKKLRMIALLALAEYGKKKISNEEAEKAVKKFSEEINKAILKEYLSSFLAF